MKTLLYISTVACVVFGLYSCDKDDDGHIANQQVKNALKTRYPLADHISWEMKNGYIVADFKAPAHKIRQEKMLNTQHGSTVTGHGI